MRKLLLSTIILIFVAACAVPQAAKEGYYSVKYKTKGSYYLDNKKCKEGIEAFEQDVKENPGSGEAHYFLGRCYLAENHSKEALVHLKEAVALSPEKADYHFWLGVAYAANKESGLERQSYLRALELDPKHVQAMTYLGHNQLEKEEYAAALKTYEKVLELCPDQPSALYNRALILNRQGKTTEEKPAWKKYLSVCPSGPMAREAANHLNALGDFEYRNYLIGSRTVTLEKIRFEPRTASLSRGSYESLDVLAEIMKNNRKVMIHVVSYRKNDSRMAEQRARSVKAYLLSGHPEIESSRLTLSWFGVPEEIKAGKRLFKEEESINFITAVQIQKEKDGPISKR